MLISILTVFGLVATTPRRPGEMELPAERAARAVLAMRVTDLR